MSKKRKSRKKSSGGSNWYTQLGLLGGVVAIMGYVYTQYFSGGEVITNDQEEEEPIVENNNDDETYLKTVSFLDYLPTSTTNQIIEHPYFALSYNEKHEQAEWVMYELDIPRLKHHVERTDDFRKDPLVKSGSASPDDYRGSGYDRGHLAAASDMAFTAQAMTNTFLMSNMCPQAPKFNRGIWRELEELTRNWARQNSHIYVVTGPVLNGGTSKEVIGKRNRVTVPGLFYKVLFHKGKNHSKAIAFLMPNEASEEPVEKFATSIDQIELFTGIDFFPNLPDRLEEQLESSFDLNEWKFSKALFERRVNTWNKRG